LIFLIALAQKSLDPLSSFINGVKAGKARTAEIGKAFCGQALTLFMYPCLCWL